MPSSRKVLAKFNTQGKYILGTEYFRLTIESYIPGIISNQYKVTWSERTYETKKKKKAVSDKTRVNQWDTLNEFS